MYDTLMRSLAICCLGFGLVALSACAEQTEVEPPAIEEPLDAPEVVEEDPTMADTTMMEEPMEEEPMEEEDAM